MTVEGKFGIKASVIADSVCAVRGVRLTTFEVEYPRMILAELNTHRMFSRNTASSRAIPFNKMLEQLTARPVRFGQANPGMQDKGVDYDEHVSVEGDVWLAGGKPESAWYQAQEHAVEFAKGFYKAGYHKQVYNRLVEPFQMVKSVISATELANFFWLRDHESADPTIQELAKVMRAAYEQSSPALRNVGEWHLPYVFAKRDDEGVLRYYDTDGGEELTDKDAIIMSTARCAAVSFRNSDYDLQKCREVYDRLVKDDRKHASALEHQATPIRPTQWPEIGSLSTGGLNLIHMSHTWEAGISHLDSSCCFWSGNFRGWIQARKLLTGENMEGWQWAV